MTATEAANVLKMKTSDLVHYDLVDSALLPNLQTQRDDAITRIEKFDADHQKTKDELEAAQKLVDSLGGTELAQKLKRQQEREQMERDLAEAERRKEELAAKLAELPVEG